ncbi:MAG: malonyl-ACP O-methyltransferase BioC [Pseudomonadales bacterium]|nr:malonyl-ACP O-methyltransferase BioC [Pseudomonadales bacterium]
MSADSYQLDKQRIARSFGRAAASYDFFAALQRRVADHLLAESAGHNRKTRILDLGSGTGYGTEKLCRKFPAAEIYSLDLALGMLQFAALKNPGIETGAVCGDAERLPFAAATFDLIFSSLSMQWCRDHSAFFSELKRILCPDGRCFLSTFGPDTLREVRAAWSIVDDFVHVNQFADAGTLKKMAEQENFTHVSLKAESHQVHYAGFAELATELKAIGAHNMNRGQASGLTGRDRLARFRQIFESYAINGKGIPVTWEVFYLGLHA